MRQTKGINQARKDKHLNWEERIQVETLQREGYSGTDRAVSPKAPHAKPFPIFGKPAMQRSAQIEEKQEKRGGSPIEKQEKSS